jgi:death on curing protein
MRYLTLGEVVELHQRLLTVTGGAFGIRDLGLLESALAQPKATFDGVDLHPTLVDKAAALGFALVANHPFVDSNDRVGHAAMEVFLAYTACSLTATADLVDVPATGLPLRPESLHSPTRSGSRTRQGDKAGLRLEAIFGQ